MLCYASFFPTPSCLSFLSTKQYCISLMRKAQETHHHSENRTYQSYAAFKSNLDNSAKAFEYFSHKKVTSYHS